MSLGAYERTRSITETPRAMERRLMSQITGEMIDAHTAGKTGAALMPALHRNREVWSTFSAACSAAGNGLPLDLRARIVSIALWVDRFTSEVAAGRDSIEELININRLIIDGLTGENAAA